MSSSNVIPDEAKDLFWSVVKVCLREFHEMPVEAVRRKSARFRNKIEQLPFDAMEYFYHSEPFDVACDIANHPLNLEGHLSRYLQIRDEEHGNGTLKQIPRRPSKPSWRKRA